MNTKLQNYIQLAGKAAAEVTQNTRNWTGFLTTASRLYRYSFPDQLMIHAQRPKATACAEFNLWSGRMNRHIRRGSKGIGLVYQLELVAVKLANDFWKNYHKEIMYECEGSLLEGAGKAGGQREVPACRRRKRLLCAPFQMRL